MAEPCDKCQDVGCDECTPCNSTPPVEECVTPVYTNNGCYPEQHTDCVLSDIPDDPCIPISENTQLTEVIQNLIIYIKNIWNRITPDDSIEILVNEENVCGDVATIKVRIDPDEDNALELREDGLFATGGVETPITPEDTDSISITAVGDVDHTISANLRVDLVTGDGDNILQVGPNGVYVPPPNEVSIDCETIGNVFSDDENEQQNTIDQSTYGFLGTGNDSCFLISPPTGFAVTGTDRVSAFGAMEWFDTLEAANISAISGETVIIYNDTVENLVPKTGVHYKGHGVKKIGNLTVNGPTPYQGTLSDLDIQGNVTIDSDLSGTRTKIHTTNVTVRGNFTMSGYSDWVGGTFTDNTKSFTVTEFSKVKGISSVREHSINGPGSEISYSDLIDTGNTTFVNAVLSVAAGAKAHFNNVRTLINKGIYVGNLAEPGCSVTNNYSYSDSNIGISVHTGYQSIASTTLFVGNTGESNSGVGIQIVGNGNEVDPNIVENLIVTGNNTAKSNTGVGLFVKSCSVDGFTASSNTGFGAQIASGEFDYINNIMRNCIVTSKGNVACNALRDMKFVNCTFTSLWNDENGHALSLGPLNINRPAEHYFAVGCHFLTYNSSAYMIKGDASVLAINLRMGLNTFVCQNGTTSPNTIDLANITPLSVLYDAYGNMIY